MLCWYCSYRRNEQKHPSRNSVELEEGTGNTTSREQVAEKKMLEISRARFDFGGRPTYQNDAGRHGHTTTPAFWTAGEASGSQPIWGVQTLLNQGT